MSMKNAALMAGSSLLAAALYLAAPGAALAQTCSPTTLPGDVAGPDTYNCLAGTFPTGITYSSAGALTVNMVANGAVVNTTLTANGVNLTGNGADTVTWNSTVGGVTGGTGTAGPVIEAISGTGAISITTGAVMGTANGVTRGIRAVSTGGGAITMTTGTVSASATSGVNAIEAVTTGNINISTTGIINGRQRSIFTNTSGGSGTTIINAAGNLTGGTFSVPAGGIEAITGTGALTINLNAGTTTVNLVKTSGGGVGTINTVAGLQLVLLDMNSAAAVTTNNVVGSTLGSNNVNNAGDALMVQGASAGAVIINNDGRAKGRFSMAGATGPVTFRNTTGDNALTMGWQTSGANALGSGADLIDNTAGGTIAGALNTTIAFGGGADRFVNAGRLITERLNSAGSFVLTGLETFENSGLILLGSQFESEGQAGKESDLQINDRLVAQGTAFVGSGDSRVAMDVKLAAVTQAGCPATPTAADCLDFTGGSTAGSTVLTLRDQEGIGYSGAPNAGITLVAGSSAAENFVLDPTSDYYVDTPLGPALQKRLVAYHFVYDEDSDSHKLVGALADEAFQAGTFATSAQETWRSTVGTWFSRQADLRATPGGLETSGGVWARIGAGASERELTVSNAGYNYDLSHKQTNAHLLLGADLLSAMGPESALVAGAMIGFVRSDVEFDATPTETISNGFTGGLYASYLAGPLFVDALVNVNLLHLKAEVPNMNLGIGIPLRQDMKSLGGQVEAGWRFDLGEVFIEPLAGVSYVTTKFDDIAIPGGGGTFDFEDKYTSLRFGGGARVGLEAQLLGMIAAYSLTGRYWNETEGENGSTVVVANGGTRTALMDDVAGGFSEVAANVSLYGDGGAVSGFVNLGGMFADGYQAIDLSGGVRLRW